MAPLLNLVGFSLLIIVILFHVMNSSMDMPYVSLSFSCSIKISPTKQSYDYEVICIFLHKPTVDTGPK